MSPPPSKRAKRSRANFALSAPRILNSDSPILNNDIHAFLVNALSPVQWAQYTDEERRSLVDSFPPAYRRHEVESEGRLECPVTVSFVQNDGYLKAAIARFKRDVELGFWEESWRAQARRAMKDRTEGKFDQYLTEHAEEMFGEEDVENRGTPKDSADDQADIGSTSVNEKGKFVS